MPNLHELFDAASGDLPPLPDLAPSARRIVRRRHLAARTSAAVLSSALVIGVGTFALSAQNSGNARDAANSPPRAYSQQYVLDTLRSLWPNKNQQLNPEDSTPMIDVMQDGQQVGFVSFGVFSDVALFPGALNCAGQDKGCLTTTTDDGDKVLGETLGEGSALAYSTPSPSAGWPTKQAWPSLNPSTMSVNVLANIRGYRLHGSYLGLLNALGSNKTALLTDQQALDIAESPAYEQLIESAVAASSVNSLAKPGYTQIPVDPSASASGGYITPPSATPTTVTTLPPPSISPSSSVGATASSFPSASPSIGSTASPTVPASGGASQVATPTPTPSAS